MVLLHWRCRGLGGLNTQTKSNNHRVQQQPTCAVAQSQKHFTVYHVCSVAPPETRLAVQVVAGCVYVCCVQHVQPPDKTSDCCHVLCLSVCLRATSHLAVRMCFVPVGVEPVAEFASER